MEASSLVVLRQKYTSPLLDTIPRRIAVILVAIQSSSTDGGRIRSALFAGHGKERSRFLLHVLAGAVRARDPFFVVLHQGEDRLKGLLAVFADVVVYGHGGTSHGDSLRIVARFEW